MEPKSKERIFVGYDDGSKSVMYYNKETRRVLTSRNFRFLSLHDSETPPEPDAMTPMPGEGEYGDRAQPNGDKLQPKENTESRKRKLVEEEEEQPSNKRLTRGIKMDYKNLQDPFPDEDDEENFLNIVPSNEEINAIIAGDELTDLADAKKSEDWPEWEKAIQIELNQLREMGTWKLVEKPPDSKPIANKWTFIKKRNKSGEITKHKARLVAKGCAQRPGYDYVETFSPVVRIETIRVILALVPIKSLKIQQMDVKGAYLNGQLKEKVYMRQPEGYEDKTGRVCELVKTLYGLKQSGREWNNELDHKLKRFGFKRLLSDPCAYMKERNDELVIITVWVDDLLIFGTSNKCIEQTKSDLRTQWEVTDLGEPTKIIGIEITHTENCIKISQRLYVEAILKREGMSNANSVTTPLDTNIKLEPNPEGNEGNRSNSFAKFIGELQFLANGTRPDIAFAVNRLAAYTANPSIQHHTALKRILRYLAGTRNLGIIYSKNPYIQRETLNIFYGFADAAYANHNDHRSTSGYVFLAAGGAITWKSKKQTTIALSSTQAEYVALSEAGREACWLQNLYRELGYPQREPILIKGDNDGSISMAKNQQFHNRSKHIAIRWHWIRELIEEKVITIESCRDPEQTADILTKALPRPKHRQHVLEMGLIAITGEAN